MSDQPQVAALFVRADSIYKQMAGVDCWDIDRDARKWPGGCPVVAHPPCRAWGRLSHMAKPRPDEMDLARWSVQMVRRWGGVLEHPSASRLWADQGLALPGYTDTAGGWTLPINQHWFGHRAEKKTLLYIVGCSPREIPVMPIVLGEAPCVIGTPGRFKGKRLRPGDQGWRPETAKAEREHTPPELARWLVELARRCRVEERAAA